MEKLALLSKLVEATVDNNVNVQGKETHHLACTPSGVLQNAENEYEGFDVACSRLNKLTRFSNWFFVF